MAPSRKRGRHEMEAAEPAVEPPKERSMLDRVRSMWEFAALTQWIFTFGKVVKIDDDMDTEELEIECLNPNSIVLRDIGLALLKFVSSHRGLTLEIFDEYTRRQYVAKAPQRNPYGVDEEPLKFNVFNVFTKIRILQQLTQWTMINPDRIRERMEEQKDTEQTIWRIEPFGWDSEDRTYIVLDDNRLYRQTAAPPPPPPASKPKKGSKKAKAAQRASKRRKVAEAIESEADADETLLGDTTIVEEEDDGLGGMKWECLCVSLEDYTGFLSTIEKSRDPNEKVLRKRLVDELLPILEKQEEARKRKAAQKERELLNLEKLATAKRSSRIAGKMEMQKQEDDAREAERKKQADLVMAKKEQEKWLKLEKERESRMITREQRLKEREARRIIHEEELANLSEDSKKIDVGGRLSERHLKAEIEKKKQALEELAEEEDWIFDCICGAYGQIDDGTHSIACDKCNIWQHSKCVGVSQKDADSEDFSFICKTCQRRAEDEERAKTRPPIKIKLNRPGSSSSVLPPASNGTPAVVFPVNANENASLDSQEHPQSIPGSPVKPKHSTPKMATWKPASGTASSNGSAGQHPPRLGQSSPILPPPNYAARHDQSQFKGGLPGSSPPSMNGIAQQQPSTVRPSSGHAFSSPQRNSPMNLPPPAQPPIYNFASGNGLNYNQTTQVVSTPRKPQESPQMTNPNPANGRPLTSDSNPFKGGNASSPLAAPPILNKANTPILSSPANKIQASTPTMHIWKPIGSSPPQVVSNPPTETQAAYNHNQHQASTLPPTVTGLSPTKHSPPRSTASNGSFTSATPSILPPVASLSPSFHKQILTPPVKPSDPERSRVNGQASSP